MQSKLSLEDVQKSFENSVVLDPSCFWSRKKFSYVEGIYQKFHPKTIFVPQRLFDYLQKNDFENYYEFMRLYWRDTKNKNYETDLRSAWKTIRYMYKKYRISPPPKIDDLVGHKLDKRKQSKLRDELKQLKRELRKQYKEGDVLYDIIVTSYFQQAYVIGFGNSWPPWAKKIGEKFKGRFHGSAKWAGEKIRGLHRWKNKNIKSRIASHRELFSEAAGWIGTVIFASVGAPLIDGMLDHLPFLGRDQIEDEGGSLLGDLIITVIEE